MTGFEETEFYIEMFNYYSYRRFWFYYLPLRYTYIDFTKLMYSTLFIKVKSEMLGVGDKNK